jgi:uncharacterized protein (DUF3084 family)
MLYNDLKRENSSMIREKDDEIEELKAIITQETTLLQDKDMQLESKTMELESLRRQLQEQNSSLIQSPSITGIRMVEQVGPREGWLEIRSAAKGSGRDRSGWVRTYVVLSEKKLFFYAGQNEHKTHKPKMIIELDKVKFMLWIYES